MLRALAFLLVLVPIAGCLGSSEEPVAPAAGADAAEDGAIDAVAEAEPAVVAAEGSTIVDAAVSYAGSTPTGACVFPAGACEWPVAGSEDWHLLDVAGQPVKLALVITYGEQAPGMEFYASICKGETEGAECEEYTTAASPMTIEYDLAGYPADGTIGISLGSVGASTPAGMAFGPADFSVEGVLTTLAPAAPASP